MTIEQLRRLHSAQPFKAFDILTADSRTLTVEHPEQLALSEIGRVIAVARPDGTIENVDLLLVVSLKPRPNGRLGRSRHRSQGGTSSAAAGRGERRPTTAAPMEIHCAGAPLRDPVPPVPPGTDDP